MLVFMNEMRFLSKQYGLIENMPVSILRETYNLPNNSVSRYHYYSHFTDEKPRHRTDT